MVTPDLHLKERATSKFVDEGSWNAKERLHTLSVWSVARLVHCCGFQNLHQPLFLLS